MKANCCLISRLDITRLKMDSTKKLKTNVKTYFDSNNFIDSKDIFKYINMNVKAVALYGLPKTH